MHIFFDKVNSRWFQLLDVAASRRRLKDGEFVDAETSRYLQTVTQDLRRRYFKIDAKIESEVAARQKIVFDNIQNDLPILQQKALLYSSTFLVVALTAVFAIFIFLDYRNLSRVQILYLSEFIGSLFLVSALSFLDLYYIVYSAEKLVGIEMIYSGNVFKYLL